MKVTFIGELNVELLAKKLLETIDSKDIKLTEDMDKKDQLGVIQNESGFK